MSEAREVRSFVTMVMLYPIGPNYVCRLLTSTSSTWYLDTALSQVIICIYFANPDLLPHITIIRWRSWCTFLWVLPNRWLRQDGALGQSGLMASALDVFTPKIKVKVKVKVRDLYNNIFMIVVVVIILSIRINLKWKPFPYVRPIYTLTSCAVSKWTGSCV